MTFSKTLRGFLATLIACFSGAGVGAYQCEDWDVLPYIEYVIDGAAALFTLTWLLSHQYERRTDVLKAMESLYPPPPSPPIEVSRRT